jgi:hypothetical protein
MTAPDRVHLYYPTLDELDALVLAQDAGLAHAMKLRGRETPPNHLVSRPRLHESLPARPRR